MMSSGVVAPSLDVVAVVDVHRSRKLAIALALASQVVRRPNYLLGALTTGSRTNRPRCDTRHTGSVAKRRGTGHILLSDNSNNAPDDLLVCHFHRSRNANSARSHDLASHISRNHGPPPDALSRANGPIADRHCVRWGPLGRCYLVVSCVCVACRSETDDMGFQPRLPWPGKQPRGVRLATAIM